MSEKTLQTHSRGSIVFKQIISCPKRAAFCHLHNVFIINHLPFSSASKGPFRLLIAWRLASTRRVFRQSEQPFERTRAQRLHAHPFPFAASPACFRLPTGHPAHSSELDAHFQKVVFIVINVYKTSLICPPGTPSFRGLERHAATLPPPAEGQQRRKSRFASTQTNPFAGHLTFLYTQCVRISLKRSSFVLR